MNFNVEIITPAVAKEYLKLNTSNRKINKSVVSYYAKMMGNGEWELNGEPIKFADSGCLLDGQHRLMACVKANVSFQTVVERDVTVKAFDTLDQGYTRGKGQIFGLANIPNGNNLASAINKYLMMGRSRITSMDSAFPRRTGRIQFSPRECLEEYNSSPEYWQELFKVARSMYARYRLISQSDTTAIMAHLNKRCQHDYTCVVGFFNQLFFEEMTEIPVIRELRQRLINDSQSSVKMTLQMRTQLIRKVWDYYKSGAYPKKLKRVGPQEEAKPFE